MQSAAQETEGARIAEVMEAPAVSFPPTADVSSHCGVLAFGGCFVVSTNPWAVVTQ
jgi:hypothetical protein